MHGGLRPNAQYGLSIPYLNSNVCTERCLDTTYRRRKWRQGVNQKIFFLEQTTFKRRRYKRFACFSQKRSPRCSSQKIMKTFLRAVAFFLFMHVQYCALTRAFFHWAACFETQNKGQFRLRSLAFAPQHCFAAKESKNAEQR